MAYDDLAQDVWVECAAQCPAVCGRGVDVVRSVLEAMHPRVLEALSIASPYDEVALRLGDYVCSPSVRTCLATHGGLMERVCLGEASGTVGARRGAPWSELDTLMLRVALLVLAAVVLWHTVLSALRHRHHPPR